MARVLIAVPTFENISPDTFKALWDMDKGGHEVLFEFVRGHDCATARNRIADRARELKVDYLMMVDGDVTPPTDALVNLIGHNVECVSGFYLHRDKDTNEPTDRTCACKLADEIGIPYFDYPLESEYTRNELSDMRERGEHLVEIHGGGMGCVLVRAEVFDRISYPWFDWVNYRNEHRGMLSEDLYFCEKLRKAGIKRHLDTRVACGHLFRRIERAD